MTVGEYVKAVKGNTVTLSSGRFALEGFNVTDKEAFTKFLKKQVVQVLYSDKQDKYGRQVGRIVHHGVDVADYMLGNGYGENDDPTRKGTNPFAIESWRLDNAFKSTAPLTLH